MQSGMRMTADRLSGADKKKAEPAALLFYINIIYEIIRIN